MPPPFTRLVFYGGDNMLGRAVQLSLPNRTKGEELIFDSCTSSHYLDLCLQHPSANEIMSINKIRSTNSKNAEYLFNDLSKLQIYPPPQVRVLNLETSVTSSINNFDIPKKGINYHMNAKNLNLVINGLLSTKHSSQSPIPTFISFANNHSLDFGKKAFAEETLPLFETLQNHSPVQFLGCGKTILEASKPGVIKIESDFSIQMLACATVCSGTPLDWQACSTPGILVIPGLVNQDAVAQALSKLIPILQEMRKVRGLIVLSVHWGGNWAYRYRGDKEGQGFRQMLAHTLIDLGLVDVLYGHSSHHTRGLEIYKEKLVMYGAGDLVNDYEGFGNPGEESYQTLGAVFVVDIEAGMLKGVFAVPMYVDRLSLRRVLHSSKRFKPLAGSLIEMNDELDEFAAFINLMSTKDCLGIGHPLLFHVLEDDSVCPGGPILVAKV